MFQLFKGKRNEKRSLKLPPGLSKKDQRRVQEVIDRAKKNDGIPRTAQQSIPFDRMFPDGICRVGSFYTKTIRFQDINYQLAQQEDKTAIFEEWCGFLNFFDSSIHFELSFMNMTTDAESFEAGIRIPYRKDAFNSVRDEYSEMLKNQLAQGNNGLTKTKFLTFGIEADSMKQAKPRLEHVQNDLLNNFKQLGVRAEVLNGYQRLKLMHDMFHMGDPEDKFRFDWKWLAESGLSVKDFIAPTAFAFPGSRTFQMGSIFGAMSYLQITASDLSDQLLKDFLDMDSSQIITMHIQSVDQTEAIKTIKHNQLIGLSGIKESIKKIKAYALSNKDSDDLNIHMCFLGNPGSGKTEVARYIAGILYENKILPTKKIVEVDRSGLVSQYFGATAEKTRSVIASAMGGVLFIDEAYALGNNSDHGITDYGKEAIDTLVKAMEDYRGKFCVILAGYKNEMLQMLSTNPGFKSRIQFTLDFPNYSRDELREITEMMLKMRHYTIGNAALNRILDITDIKRKEPNFANAREIRNILDQVIMCQNLRCAGSDDKELGIVDVNKFIQDAKINLPTSGEGADKKVLTGEEELDQLIGLASVKRMIKKIKAYAKKNKGAADFNLHMCFYGNPGTGKTEVARILSRILYDAGVLDEAKLVETDGLGLLGKFVGETGPKTEAKINDAMNGVLFIDEAYSLAGSNSVSGGATNYGDEAIAVLLKGMEDHRGQFCVILAGYKDEMKAMLSANPGFESRIQFTLEFPDYSREELGEIAKAFLAKKKYEIEDTALERLLDITEYFRKKPNFANARTVRNILDQVLMNQNLRTEDISDDNTIIIDDVEDYLTDEGIDLSKPDSGKRKIGFL